MVYILLVDERIFTMYTIGKALQHFMWYCLVTLIMFLIVPQSLPFMLVLVGFGIIGDLFLMWVPSFELWLIMVMLA